MIHVKQFWPAPGWPNAFPLRSISSCAPGPTALLSQYTDSDSKDFTVFGEDGRLSCRLLRQESVVAVRRYQQVSEPEADRLGNRKGTPELQRRLSGLEFDDETPADPRCKC